MLKKNYYFGRAFFISLVLLLLAGNIQAAPNIGAGLSVDGNLSVGGTLSAVGAGSLQGTLSVNSYLNLGTTNSSAKVSLYQPSTSVTGLSIDTPANFNSKVINFKIASSSQMVMTNSAGAGYVGLNTSSPNRPLDVAGSIRGKKINFTTKTHAPMVSFMFDDGYESQYLVAKPVFDARNVVGTVAVISSMFGAPSRMTTTEIQALYTAGWEIANHTETHPILTSKTEARVRAEFVNANNAINALGIPVYDCVYPSHVSNAMVRRVARDYFRACRGQAGAANSYPLNSYNLNSFDMSNLSTAGNPLLGYPSLADEEFQVDVAKANSAWIIFYMHSPTSDQASPLGALIDYIQAQGLPIVTIKQGMDLVENEVDGGDDFRFSTGGGLYSDGGFNLVKTSAYSGNVLANSATSNAASVTKSGTELQSTGTWNGSGSSNIGLYVSTVTGGTNNYDAIFNGGGNVGIGTLFPSNSLSFGGSSAKTIAMERHTITGNAGNNLTVSAGGATVGATNKNAGNLILRSGISTGTGFGQVQLWTSPAGASGSADNAPVQRLTVIDSGNVGIGVNIPTAGIHLKAGTTAASTAPFKFTSGPLTTTAETGTLEFLTNNLYYTASTNGGTLAAQRQSVPGITTGTVVPTSIPLRVGDVYVDTTHIKVYISTGTASSADWKAIN